jgi:hypothetical protein
MNRLRFIRPPAPLAVGFITLIVLPSLVLAAQDSPAALSHNSNAAVTVTDDARTFTLDNGIVKATVRKDSGSMGSLLYNGVEMMGGNGGYWEQAPEGAPTLTNTATIDPPPTAEHAPKSPSRALPEELRCSAAEPPAAAPIVTWRSATPLVAATAASTSTPSQGLPWPQTGWESKT